MLEDGREEGTGGLKKPRKVVKVNLKLLHCKTSRRQEELGYTGCSKSLCAHDDYNTIVRCTETI